MIKLYTLGDFDIKVDDVSILQTLGNQHRVLKLFKYFLTFHGKKLLPERIIEDIWGDSDYKDPIKALRTQISRVRNMFELKGCVSAFFFNIDYIDGYYIFELSKDCFIDFIELQGCMDRSCPIDRKEAEEYFGNIMKLYRGEYLRELGDEEWLIPIRNRFDRQYIGCVSKYLQHLVDEGKYVEILSVSEEAMGYKPYEELLHIYYMDALCRLGQWEYAMEHYKYCTTRMYKELGETPSNVMKDMYRKIKLNHAQEPDIDCDYFDFNQNGLCINDGSMVCERTDFMSLCSFESRLKERFSNEAYLGVVTINKNGLQKNHSDEIRNGMQTLVNSMRSRLRKGDALSQWNEKQLLVLFHSLVENDVDVVVGRIRQTFDSTTENKNLNLNIRFKKI